MLTVKELETYFTPLRTQLASVDNIKIKRKWPKIEKGVTTKLPTKVPMLDEVCEKILPSALFIPVKKIAPGNVLWRLKLICPVKMLFSCDECPKIFSGLQVNRFAGQFRVLNAELLFFFLYILSILLNSPLFYGDIFFRVVVAYCDLPTEH